MKCLIFGGVIYQEGQTINRRNVFQYMVMKFFKHINSFFFVCLEMFLSHLEMNVMSNNLKFDQPTQ